jgi:twitching motility protein PilT
MQLMDDALFNLWRDEKVNLEDALGIAHQPDELAKRIVNYKRSLGTVSEEEENAVAAYAKHE